MLSVIRCTRILHLPHVEGVIIDEDDCYVCINWGLSVTGINQVLPPIASQLFSLIQSSSTPFILRNFLREGLIGHLDI